MKACINREDARKIPQISYTVIVVTIKINSLEVVTPPSIYRGCSTWKKLWEQKFTPINMTSCGHPNVR